MLDQAQCCMHSPSWLQICCVVVRTWLYRTGASPCCRTSLVLHHDLCPAECGERSCSTGSMTRLIDIQHSQACLSALVHPALFHAFTLYPKIAVCPFGSGRAELENDTQKGSVIQIGSSFPMLDGPDRLMARRACCPPSAHLAPSDYHHSCATPVPVSELLSLILCIHLSRHDRSKDGRRRPWNPNLDRV